MTASAMVMPCTERFDFSKFPFREKVFIFLNAAYESLNPEEVWQLCSQ